MHEYDLSRLDGPSFERLVRALSFAELGPGGVVYPAGPDGARDFTYEGSINGFEPKGWNGYLVIQAKFAEKAGNSRKDIDWLKACLQKEHKKYISKSRGLRRPEYYIVATNISLSGADSGSITGGSKKVSDYLETWKSSIGLRDYHVWTKDHIIDLLAAHPNVRQTYAAWVTSGDVLEHLLSSLVNCRPNFATHMKRAIKRRIVADQFVSLNEAGNRDAKRLETSKVFTDLPVSISHNGEWKRTSDNSMFVSRVISVCQDALDHDSISDLKGDGGSDVARSSRVVLLGGPGQGKSTTGLFVVQLYRAALLKDDPDLGSDPIVFEVTRAILASAAQQQVRIAFPRRFPIHVILPAYADLISIAKRDYTTPPSLLNHIAVEIGRFADGKRIEQDDLREWLRAYPWLIVLDGLDEVPPSGERLSIIDAIGGLVSEISEAKGDVLLIVTSRPQGYNKDLEERHWQHWQLADLTKDLARKYAVALSKAQYPLDTDRQAKIMAGLDRAMIQPATARLMVSPLQVTIMQLIIDGGGSAPVGRWALFDEYYQVLKRREKAKGGETLEVLERNWDHLDPVHQRAGLILQSESEESGGAVARFTPPRLRLLVKNYLKSCGFNISSQETQAQELARLALNRLVLLSVRQQGDVEDKGLITFDVRSLQEYMAAGQLTTERELDAERPTSEQPPRIEDRLAHIAGMAHWRHVFLIASSRCFSEPALSNLRSIVVSIPRGLDTNELDRLAYNGAVLALDMLADGIGITHPISRRKLTEHALDLLDLGHDVFDDRLIEVINSETSEITEARINVSLSTSKGTAYLSSWKLLIGLCAKEPIHYTSMAINHWPDSPIDALNILDTSGHLIDSEPLEKVVVSTLAKFTLEDALSAFRKIWHKKRIQQRKESISIDIFKSKTLEALTDIARSDRSDAIDVAINSRLGFVSCALYPIKPSVDFKNFQFTSEMDQEWRALKGAIDLRNSFSQEGFASWIDSIPNKSAVIKMLTDGTLRLSWPIELAAYYLDRGISGKELADAIRNGSLWQIEDLLAAEASWIGSGINFSDLTRSWSETPFEAGIAREVTPVIYSDSVGRDFINLSTLDDVLADEGIKIATANVNVLRLHETALVSELIGRGSSRPITPKTARSLLNSENLKSVLPQFLNRLDDEVWKDVELLKEVSDEIVDYHALIDTESAPLEKIVRAIKANAALRPMLYIVALGVVDFSRSKVDILDSIPISDLQFEPTDTKRTLIAISIIRILKKISVTCAELKPLLTADADFIGMLIENDIIDYDTKILILVFLIKNTPNPDSVNGLRVVLRKVLDTRKSNLTDSLVWIDRMELPFDAFKVIADRSKE